MSVKAWEKYQPNASSPSPQYPYGSLRQETALGVGDGTPLDVEWGNDFEAFKQTAFLRSGLVPSGNTDTVTNSEMFNAMQDGTTRSLWERSAAESGHNLVAGSFEEGGTLVNSNDVLWSKKLNKIFSGSAGTVTAGTNPVSGGFVDVSGALTISYFDTVSDMAAFRAHVAGNTVKTRGYYSVDDGGGAEYLISNGVPAQDFDDAGSVPITGSLFAKLTKQPIFDLRQFGVKASDLAYSVINDIGIANAIKRARFGFCQIMLNGVFYYTKPIVIDYCTWIEGNVLGSDPSFTSRLIKVGNATSGLPSLGYPGHAGSINYDVDAGIIVTRQNAATPHTQGVVLKNFLLVSQDKSRYALYAPHMVDFDMQFDSRGFNTGTFWHDIYLGRLAGRHIGLGDDAPDKAASIGVWSTVFSTTATCGNSVSFRLSLNGFCRGMQVPNFGNGVLERVTLENIRKPAGGAAESYGIFATDSYFTGQISCEGSSTCILRAGNGSNFDVTLSAVFHVTESTPTEGLVHSLNGGRITLQGGSNIFGDLADQKIINESGGYLDIGANVKLLNIKLLNSDTYRYKDRTFGVGQTAGVTSTTIASGSPVLFAALQGLAKASLVGGVVTFNSPALVKVTLQGRNMTSGTIAFGLNGALNDVITVGQDRAVIVPVVAGDVMTVQATTAVVLGSTGGVRMYIEPVL
ncbi:head-binding domain-containing protein [Aeromonas phage vB_AceP_PAc]|nr:head-binding domain-containing protein [Aeromonas phage vB_AceP_PAc]